MSDILKMVTTMGIMPTGIAAKTFITHHSDLSMDICAGFSWNLPTVQQWNCKTGHIVEVFSAHTGRLLTAYSTAWQHQKDKLSSQMLAPHAAVCIFSTGLLVPSLVIARCQSRGSPSTLLCPGLCGQLRGGMRAGMGMCGCRSRVSRSHFCARSSIHPIYFWSQTVCTKLSSTVVLNRNHWQAKAQTVQMC